MTTWSVILLAIAGVTLTSHTFLLMCYVVSCYRAWTKAEGADGFLRVAGRAILATMAYGALASVMGMPLFVLLGLLGSSPGLTAEAHPFAGLAVYAVVATFALTFFIVGWDYPLAIALVLIAFFVLGLVTMLPGLGYGSKRLWGVIGLGAYLAYLSAYAAYVFAQIAANQGHYIAGFVVTVASLSLAAGVMRLYLRFSAWLTKSNPPAPLAPASAPSP